MALGCKRCAGADTKSSADTASAVAAGMKDKAAEAGDGAVCSSPENYDSSCSC